MRRDIYIRLKRKNSRPLFRIPRILDQICLPLGHSRRQIHPHLGDTGKGAFPERKVSPPQRECESKNHLPLGVTAQLSKRDDFKANDFLRRWNILRSVVSAFLTRYRINLFVFSREKSRINSNTDFLSLYLLTFSRGKVIGNRAVWTTRSSWTATLNAKRILWIHPSLA